MEVVPTPTIFAKDPFITVKEKSWVPPLILRREGTNGLRHGPGRPRKEKRVPPVPSHGRGKRQLLLRRGSMPYQPPRLPQRAKVHSRDFIRISLSVLSGIVEHASNLTGRRGISHHRARDIVNSFLLGDLG